MFVIDPFQFTYVRSLGTFGYLWVPQPVEGKMKQLLTNFKNVSIRRSHKNFKRQRSLESSARYSIQTRNARGVFILTGYP